MSKKQIAIALMCSGLIASSAAVASWQSDCQTIESQGPSPGACRSVETTIGVLQPYAPFKTFINTSADGDGLEGKFPWGSPQWASQGSGGGGSGILGPDQDGRGTQGGGSGFDSGSTGTFN